MTKKVIKRKIVISYICIGALFLFAFGSIVSYILFKNGRREVIDYLSINNHNVYKSINLLFDSSYISTHDLYTNDEVILKALYFDELDKIERQQIHDNLYRIVKASPILESIYIYNKQQDVIYSSIGTPKDKESFYENNLFDKIDGLKNRKNIFLVRDVTLSDITLNYDDKVITFIFRENKLDIYDSSMMIVNISQSKLNNIIYKNFIPSNSMKSFIIDNEGTPIAYGNDDLIDDDIKNEDYIQQILNSKNNEGNFTGIINNQKYIISYTKSNKWGCTFISMASYNDLLVEVYRTLNIIGVLTAVFIIISIMTSLYSTSTIYSPINKLVQKATNLSNISPKKYSHELEYVFLSIEDMKKEIDNLEDKVINYSAAKRNNILKKVLNGNFINDEEFINNNVYLEGPSYVVTVLRINYFPILSKNTKMNDMLVFRNNLINIAIKFLGNKFKIEIVENELEFIPIIINICDENSDYINNLKRIIAKMQKEFIDTYNLSFCAGIGHMVHTIDELRNSFLNAVEATNYRIIFGENAIISESDLHSIKRKEYVYPINIEKKIIDSLKLSQKEKVKDLMIDFTNEVKEFEYNEILLSYSQLVLVIVRTAKQINYSLNKNIHINYIEMQTRLKNCNTLTEINEVVLKLLFDIIDKQNSYNYNKNTEMINRIKEFVNNNYCNEEFCIEMIAQKEHLSVNYLRTVFKNEVGISLSEYTNNLRFERAKRLLIETTYPAKKIAQMCGFNSSDYFYYAFKKHTGMSPTVFRKQNLI